MAKVDVKLTGPTWVGGQMRQADEIVEMDPKIASQFGKVIRGEQPEPEQAKPKRQKRGSNNE